MVDASVDYALLGARWYAKGLYIKDRKPGSAIRARTLFRVKDGDFVYNRLFAWKGSFAVATCEQDGCYVSNEFPCFEVDRHRVDSRFLWLYFSQEHVWNEALGLSFGATPTSRNRLKEQFLLAMTIPLPPLPEQRRIVAKLDRIAANLDDARTLANEARASANALGGAVRDMVLRRLPNTVPLGDVTTVIDPNPSHRYPIYVPDGVPMVSTVNFQGDDDISTAGAPFVTRGFFQETLGRFGVREGDLVFSRKGKVGYARLLPNGLECAMTHTLCIIQPDRQRLRPRFLLHYARSPLFLSFLTGTMNPNVGVPTLGLNVIRAAPLPLPSLEIQDRICRTLDATLAGLDKLRTLHARGAAELDALMPAILDRAFKGEM
jgi:type I restriction enzyme, S subunit